MSFREPRVDVATSPFREGLFRNRVVLITGGGTGIGRACAEQYGSLGARVALCGRRAEPLEETAAALREKGIEVHTDTCDIRDADRCAAYVDGVLARFGRVDVLLNNAGGQFPSPAEVMKPKGFEAVVRNNLVGTFTMTHAVATKAMIPQKGGRVLNVIANIFRGFPGMSHTGAARAGVENLTRSLAVEWAHHNIQINAVAPGTIVSSGTDRYPPELLVKAEQQTPARRLGLPVEVAHTILFLTSDAADYVTGATLYIDGGAALWGDLWVLPDAE